MFDLSLASEIGEVVEFLCTATEEASKETPRAMSVWADAERRAHASSADRGVSTAFGDAGRTVFTASETHERAEHPTVSDASCVRAQCSRQGCNSQVPQLEQQLVRRWDMTNSRSASFSRVWNPLVSTVRQFSKQTKSDQTDGMRQHTLHQKDKP